MQQTTFQKKMLWDVTGTCLPYSGYYLSVPHPGGALRC